MKRARVVSILTMLLCGAAVAHLTACGGDDDGTGDGGIDPMCFEAAPPTLTCGAAVRLACTGPTTPVALEAPTVMATCPEAVATPVHDGPAGGFPVGATVVTWTADSVVSDALACTVDVTIEDATPPAIDCASAPTTVVRLTPDAPIDVVAPSATDACDDALEVSVAPIPTERGTTTLTASATDDAGNEGTCSFDLSVLDVFAPTGLRVLSATLTTAGATDLTLGWNESTGVDVTDFLLERAETADGPWTELATVSAATSTYTDASMPSPRAFYRITALAGSVAGGVTEPVRALAVAADEYNLSGQTVPTVSFATSLFGVVRYPTDLGDGPFPLVVMLHGNHGNCRPRTGDDECSTLTAHECTDSGFTTTPNAYGYVYLQETLAAQGYISVSLSANALNCRNDYIAERTQLILEHLRRWRGWATSGGAPFGTTFMGHVDLSRVALFGHSRGGEAVSGAPAALVATPIAGVSLSGVFAVGPTDYHTPTPSGVPFGVLLPGCDADVRTLEGLLQYDRGLDPTDENARAQVLYVGANHNFFNSEWRFDDNTRIRVCSTAQQVGGAAQRGMLEVVLSDFLAATTLPTRFPDYLRADARTPALLDTWAGRALDLRWSYAAASRRVIDDFEGMGAPTRNDLGGVNAFTNYTASIDCTGTCSRNFPHATGAVRIAWQDTEATSRFGLGGVDASGYEALSMRFASRIATINNGLTQHEITIRISDTSGVSADVPLSSIGRLPHRYTSAAEREILGTVRVPFDVVRSVAPTIDLANLESVTLVTPAPGGNRQGSVWTADVDLANE